MNPDKLLALLAVLVAAGILVDLAVRHPITSLLAALGLGAWFLYRDG